MLSNPTVNAEPEEKYEEEFVINAIAQLATVNSGQVFNQSESAKVKDTAGMLDTQTGTRFP